MQQHLPDQ